VVIARRVLDDDTIAIGVNGARPRRSEIDPGEFSSLGIAIRRSDKDNGGRQEFGSPDRRVEVCWPVGIADERTTPSDGRFPSWLARRAISCSSLRSHPCESSNLLIDVVHDQNILFFIALTMQPADILRECSLPGDRH
jgi:hypothetical protein